MIRPPRSTGHGEHRTPAVVVQQLQVRVEVDRVEVGDRDRMPLQRGPADERGLELDPDPAQLAQQLRTARVRAAHREAALLLDVLHDRSAVAAGEPHGVHDDVREHLVEHQARADHAADLAERLAAARPCGRARRRAPRARAPGARCARRRPPARRTPPAGRSPGRRTGRPRCGQGQRTDDLVVEQQRRRHHGSDTSPISLDVLTAVLGIAEHVGDLLDLAIQGHPPDQRRPVEPERVLADVAHELVGEPDGGREHEVVAVDQVDRRRLAPAQPPALSTTVSSTASGSDDDRPSAVSTSFIAANCSVASL